MLQRDRKSGDTKKKSEFGRPLAARAPRRKKTSNHFNDLQKKMQLLGPGPKCCIIITNYLKSKNYLLLPPPARPLLQMANI